MTTVLLLQCNAHCVVVKSSRVDCSTILYRLIPKYRNTKARKSCFLAHVSKSGILPDPTDMGMSTTSIFSNTHPKFEFCMVKNSLKPWKTQLMPPPILIWTPPTHTNWNTWLVDFSISFRCVLDFLQCWIKPCTI